MSLKSIVQSSVTLAFKYLGDLAGDFTLTRVAQGTYVPGTGPTITETTYTAKGAYVEFDENDLNSDLISSDLRKMLLLSDTKPEIGDKITGPDAINCEVKRVKPIQSYDTAFLYDVFITK